MLTHPQIAALIPHQGDMCLLDAAESWNAGSITCHARSHLCASNPLRRGGRLAMLCGCEYGFQAAALHGALLAGGVPQQAGYLVALRVSIIAQRYLDDPGFGELCVQATLDAASDAGLIYGFRLSSQAGRLLLEGRGTIKLPSAPDAKQEGTSF